MSLVNAIKQKENLHWVAKNSTAAVKPLAHLRTRVNRSESRIKAVNKAHSIMVRWLAGTLEIEHLLSELGCMIAHILAYDEADTLLTNAEILGAFSIYTDIMNTDNIGSFELITLANFSDLFHRVNRHFLEG